MKKQYKSKVFYYAGWNSFTHVGGAYNLAKTMPNVEFHVASAEKWPFPELPNLTFHKLYRPNCAMRIDDRFFLNTYPYEKELGDIKKYRKHFFGYIDILKKIDPNLVIADITLEIALWSKFLGYPTCVFYETVETANLRHRLAWDNVDSILVRYPESFIELVEPNIHTKMFFAGGMSKFDNIEKLPSKDESRKLLGITNKEDEKVVTFLASSHSHNNPQVKRYFHIICKALNELSKEYKTFVLYPKKDSLVQKLEAEYKNIHFTVGVFNQVHHYLSLSDVVVTAAGLGAVMEASYFRVPMLLVPAPWITGDQMIKAKALEKLGAALLIDPVSINENAIIKAINKISTDPELKAKIQDKERILIDKKGYKKLAHHIQKMLNASYCINKSSVLTKG